MEAAPYQLGALNYKGWKDNPTGVAPLSIRSSAFEMVRTTENSLKPFPDLIIKINSLKVGGMYWHIKLTLSCSLRCPDKGLAIKWLFIY